MAETSGQPCLSAFLRLMGSLWAEGWLELPQSSVYNPVVKRTRATQLEEFCSQVARGRPALQLLEFRSLVGVTISVQLPVGFCSLEVAGIWVLIEPMALGSAALPIWSSNLAFLFKSTCALMSSRHGAQKYSTPPAMTILFGSLLILSKVRKTSCFKAHFV